MNILEIKNVKKSFNDSQLHVLKDISLTVGQGEVVAIIGPSGSGKSTLLRCATLLTEMDSGDLLYSGDYAAKTNEQGVAVYADKQQLKKIRSRFGLVFQNFNLFPHFSVLKNLTDAPIQVLGRSKEEAEKKAMALLEKMGLADKADAYPCQLSGGQQQRVAIARALAMEPEILFFDEPTSALDPELTGEILKVIRQLAEDYAKLCEARDAAQASVNAKSAAADTLYSSLSSNEQGILLEVRRFAPDAFDIPTADQLLRACAVRRKELAEAETAAREARMRYELQVQQAPAPGTPEADVPAPVRSREAISTELDRVRAALAEARSSADRLDGQLHAAGDPAVLRASAEDLAARKERLETEYSALRLAMEALEGANTAGKSLYFFAPALSAGSWIRSSRTYCTTIGCHRFYL